MPGHRKQSSPISRLLALGSAPISQNILESLNFSEINNFRQSCSEAKSFVDEGENKDIVGSVRHGHCQELGIRALVDARQAASSYRNVADYRVGNDIEYARTQLVSESSELHEQDMVRAIDPLKHWKYYMALIAGTFAVYGLVAGVLAGCDSLPGQKVKDAGLYYSMGALGAAFLSFPLGMVAKACNLACKRRRMNSFFNRAERLLQAERPAELYQSTAENKI